MEDLIIAVQSLGQKDYFDYIQLLANVISIIISAVSVYVAIQVPNKIAEKQNKIALLEKRIQLYMDFSELFGNSVWWGRPNLYTFSKEKYLQVSENDKLFVTATFLFSDRLSNQITELYALYKKMHWYNSNIDGCISIMPKDVVKIIEHFFVINDFRDISSEDLYKLKELAKKFEYTIEEAIDRFNTEKITINLLSLYIEFYDLSEKVFNKEKEILEDMKNEIDIFSINK